MMVGIQEGFLGFCVFGLVTVRLSRVCPFSVTVILSPVSVAVFSMSRCSAWNADDSMAGVLSAAPLTVAMVLSCALRRDSTASGGGSVTPPVSAGCPAEAGRLPIARRRGLPSCSWMGRARRRPRSPGPGPRPDALRCADRLSRGSATWGHLAGAPSPPV